MNQTVKDKTIKYLKEFATIADKHFEQTSFIQERYDYFNDFFKKENLEKARWSDFQEMGENIHAFNSLALAKKRKQRSCNL